jgi:hypothetical protein
MNRKFYFSFLAFALTIVATVAFVVGHSTTKAASPGVALSSLPASDFVVVIDAQRALSETLPSLLAGNPALLAKMNAKLEEFEKKTGINPHSIESVAIGGRLNTSRPNGEHAVVLVRGSFKADELIDAAFTTAKAEGERFQKEEQAYEGKTIFLISPQSAPKNVGEAGRSSAPATFRAEAVIAPQPSGSGVGFGPSPRKDAKVSDLEVLEGKNSATLHAESRTDKMAITALDSNTIAIGDFESVRAAIDAGMGRNRVDDELVQQAMQTPSAVVSFSGKIPQSIIEKSNSQGGNNPFAKYVTSIRGFYGSFEINGSEAETLITLRTENAEQASDISQAINSLKVLANLGLSQSAGQDVAPRDAFAAALKGLSVTAQDNEVKIDARIPQASLAPLIRVH